MDTIILGPGGYGLMGWQGSGARMGNFSGQPGSRSPSPEHLRCPLGIPMYDCPKELSCTCPRCLGGMLSHSPRPSYGQLRVRDGRSGLEGTGACFSGSMESQPLDQKRIPLEAAFSKLSLPALCPQTPDMLLGMAGSLVKRPSTPDEPDPCLAMPSIPSPPLKLDCWTSTRVSAAGQGLGTLTR